MSFIINPYVYSVAGCVDADANAFLTATGITDPTISSAICTFVTSLKAQGLWAKFYALYPFVGGTSTTHKFNLKNPADTNAARRLTFVGGWTHTVNGAQPNGVNGYADTNFNTGAVWTTYNNSLGLYSRSIAGTAIDADFGQGGSLGEFGQNLVIRRSNNQSIYDALNSSGTGRISFINNDGRGLYVGSITAINSRKLYKNGTLQVQSTTSIVQALPSYNLYLGCYNQGNTPLFFGSKQYALAFIGLGLTDTDVSNLNTINQTFQTTLGRQV
jgi:hypothetical protein